MGKKFHLLDITKFVCAILVIMIHVPPCGTDVELNFFFQMYLARIAVPFFFVSSGFLLYRKFEQNRMDMDVVKKYIRRLVRLYTVWTLIYFVFILKDALKQNDSLGEVIFDILRDFFVVGSYRQLWYLGATAVAVGIVSFLLLKRFSINKIVICGLVLYGFGLLGQTYFGLIKPLEFYAPQLWNVLKAIKNFMMTTRNGVFEGVIFVAIGMCFAYKPIHMKLKTAVIGLIVSLCALFTETIFVVSFELARAYDMYLCLIPVAFFMFYIAIHVELPENAIYGKLRTMGMLLFYIHIWVDNVVGVMLKVVSADLAQSAIRFIITLVLSILGSIIIMKLSDVDKMRWMKRLYM